MTCLQGWLPLLATLVLAGCQLGLAPLAQPAVLTNPGPEVTRELSTAIAAMAGFASVTLADSDLTRSSELMVERTPQRDGSGELLQGRNLELPHRFGLVLRDGHCWLVHPADGQQRRLALAKCRNTAG